MTLVVRNSLKVVRGTWLYEERESKKPYTLNYLYNPIQTPSHIQNSNPNQVQRESVVFSQLLKLQVLLYLHPSAQTCTTFNCASLYPKLESPPTQPLSTMPIQKSYGRKTRMEKKERHLIASETLAVCTTYTATQPLGHNRSSIFINLCIRVTQLTDMS